jgi:hypothetical protein
MAAFSFGPYCIQYAFFVVYKERKCACSYCAKATKHTTRFSMFNAPCELRTSNRGCFTWRFHHTVILKHARNLLICRDFCRRRRRCLLTWQLHLNSKTADGKRGAAPHSSFQRANLLLFVITGITCFRIQLPDRSKMRCGKTQA